MSSTDPPSREASAVTAALHAIRQLRARIASLEARAREPVSVIGMACRLPPAHRTPESFWAFLTTGGDAVTEIAREQLASHSRAPLAELPPAADRCYAALLERIDGFDAAYFGVAPHDARRMDPQQRIGLELAVEAIEDAGYAPRQLRGANTGVFMTVTASEYGMLQLRNPEQLTAASFGFASLLANRVSFHLDLRGPSFAAESQCSSSLVVLHQAIRSLRNGECDLALVGAVNVLCAPEAMRMYESMGVLSKSGRCRTFDAAADGMVRGEGGVVLVLRRSADLQNHERAHAEILGSALGQDGRSQAFTAPNGLAQRSVIRAALGDAGIAPEAVGYVECHGTGTLLGDPIEIDALRDCYGSGAGAVHLGAVKTNIGHLEGAAGLAGLMKAILCLQHGAIPANLHYRRLNPEIEIEGTRLRPVTRMVDWTGDGDRRRIAAVSSFGAGGTNAHAIVAEPRPRSPERAHDVHSRAGARERSSLLLLTARSESGLLDVQRRWRTWLDDPCRATADAANTCLQAARSRDTHEVRCAVIGATHQDLAASLRLGPQPVRALGGPGPVLVFSGSGARFWPMSDALMRAEPVYAESLREYDAWIADLAGWSLLDALHHGGRDLTPMETRMPVAAAIQLALLRLLRSKGVHPGAVVGASLGELPAAAACGAITEREALRIALVRGRILQRCPGSTLLALMALERAQACLEELALEVDIAAINSPESVVIAGSAPDVDRLGKHLAASGVRWFPVDTGGVASHSRLVDHALPELRACLDFVQAKPPSQCRFISTSHCGDHDRTLSADYWADNVRRTVRLDLAIRHALEQGYRTFIEVGPHPVLTRALAEVAGSCGKQVNVIKTLHRELDPRDAVLMSVAAAMATGELEDNAWLKAGEGIAASMPPRDWKHSSFWLHGESPREARQDQAAVLEGIRENAGDGARAAVVQVLAEVLSQELGWPLDEIDARVPIQGLGVESLAAVSIGKKISQLLDVPVSAERLLLGSSLLDLAEVCLEHMRKPNADSDVRAQGAESVLTVGTSATIRSFDGARLAVVRVAEPDPWRALCAPCRLLDWPQHPQFLITIQGLTVVRVRSTSLELSPALDHQPLRAELRLPGLEQPMRTMLRISRENDGSIKDLELCDDASFRSALLFSQALSGATTSSLEAMWCAVAASRAPEAPLGLALVAEGDDPARLDLSGTPRWFPTRDGLPPKEQAILSSLGEVLVSRGPALDPPPLTDRLDPVRAREIVAALWQEHHIKLSVQAVESCRTVLQLVREAGAAARVAVEAWSNETGRGWLVRLGAEHAGARFHLLVFPHAGAGPRAFAAWARHLPRDVSPWGVQLPAREARAHETGVGSIFMAAYAIVEELVEKEMLGMPLVLLGHSLGAQIAFEVARELRRRELPPPCALIVSASFPPDVERTQPRALEVLRSDAKNFARALGGLPEALLNDEPLLRLILPTLQSDLALGRTTTWVPEAPLSVPILTLAGRQDRLLHPTVMEGWAQHSSNECRHEVLDGGHFFVLEQWSRVMELVARFLETTR